MRLFRLFSRKKSKSIAKERLKVLLISDRVDCSPEMMEMIKNDLIRVISKYLEIDEKETDIQIKQSVAKKQKCGGASLFAKIPIKTVRGQPASPR